MKNKVVKFLFSLFLVVTLLISQSHVASAAYGGNGTNSRWVTGGFNKAVGIQIRCIYGNQSYTDTAKNQWNGVSSKVKLVTTYSDNVIETYFDCYNSPSTGLYGYSERYYGSKKLADFDSDTSSRWDKAKCYQYKPSAKATATPSPDQRRRTCVHEVGHALSVAHVQNNAIGAVMKKGDQSVYTLYKFDKDSLKGKWGS